MAPPFDRSGTEGRGQDPVHVSRDLHATMLSISADSTTNARPYRHGAGGASFTGCRGNRDKAVGGLVGSAGAETKGPRTLKKSLRRIEATAFDRDDCYAL